MFRRFLDWLFRQGVSVRAIVSNRRANRRLNKLERQRSRMITRAKERLQKLGELRQRFNTEVDGHVADVEKMELLIKQYDRELEALRDKINIFENDMLPTLIAANRKYREMWAAETAVQVRRQTSNTLPREKMGYE